MGWTRFIGKQPIPQLVVLLYHTVSPKKKSAFENQMNMLLRAGVPVPLGGLEPKTGSRHICVTFDDGFVETLQTVLPILEAKEIPATIFVPSGNLGKKAGWESEQAGLLNSGLVASAEELLSLTKSSLFNIQSHTVSHRRLSRVTNDEARAEISNSKTAIELLLGCPVEYIALPYGDWDDRTIELIKIAGYRGVCTSERHTNPLNARPFCIGRFTVNPDDSKFEFWLKVRGGFSWQYHYERLKRLVGA